MATSLSQLEKTVLDIHDNLVYEAAFFEAGLGDPNYAQNLLNGFFHDDTFSKNFKGAALKLGREDLIQNMEAAPRPGELSTNMVHIHTEALKTGNLENLGPLAQKPALSSMDAHSLVETIEAIEDASPELYDYLVADPRYPLLVSQHANASEYPKDYAEAYIRDETAAHEEAKMYVSRNGNPDLLKTSGEFYDNQLTNGVPVANDVIIENLKHQQQTPTKPAPTNPEEKGFLMGALDAVKGVIYPNEAQASLPREIKTPAPNEIQNAPAIKPSAAPVNSPEAQELANTYLLAEKSLSDYKNSPLEFNQDNGIFPPGGISPLVVGELETNIINAEDAIIAYEQDTGTTVVLEGTFDATVITKPDIVIEPDFVVTKNGMLAQNDPEIIARVEAPLINDLPADTKDVVDVTKPAVTASSINDLSQGVDITNSKIASLSPDIRKHFSDVTPEGYKALAQEAQPAEPEQKSYEVQSGDNLWNIAKNEYGLTKAADIMKAVDHIAHANTDAVNPNNGKTYNLAKGANAHNVFKGQELNIPSKDDIMKPVDQLDHKALENAVGKGVNIDYNAPQVAAATLG